MFVPLLCHPATFLLINQVRWVLFNLGILFFVLFLFRKTYVCTFCLVSLPKKAVTSLSVYNLINSFHLTYNQLLCAWVWPLILRASKFCWCTHVLYVSWYLVSLNGTGMSKKKAISDVQGFFFSFWGKAIGQKGLISNCKKLRIRPDWIKG